MNTSVLTLGMPAVLVVAGLLFARPDRAEEPAQVTGALIAVDDATDQDPNSFQPIWLDDLDLAISIAAERNKPMMVVFR